MEYSLIKIVVMCLLMAVSVQGHAAVASIDIQVDEEGQVKDHSAKERNIEVSNVRPGATQVSVILEESDSILIPYNENDPLFKEGPFTWLLKFRINNPYGFTSNHPILGRWDAAGDDRSAGIILSEGPSVALFLSPDGSARNCFSLTRRDSLPGKEWVYLVAKYDPGKRIELQLLSADGSVVWNAKLDALEREIISSVHQSEIPFLIGTSQPGLNFEFQEFIAWDRWVGESEIRAAIQRP